MQHDTNDITLQTFGTMLCNHTEWPLSATFVRDR
jgi:hypothetical protein